MASTVRSGSWMVRLSARARGITAATIAAIEVITRADTVMAIIREDMNVAMSDVGMAVGMAAGTKGSMGTVMLGGIARRPR